MRNVVYQAKKASSLRIKLISECKVMVLNNRRVATGKLIGMTDFV